MKIEIKAEPRSVQGTGASRRLRRESKVPGILYGAGKDAQPIQLDHKDLFFKLKMEAFHASILDMEIGAEKSQVLLRDYQMHPFKPMILHADFQRVAADRKIHMKVPLHFVNADISPGVKVAGGAGAARDERPRHHLPAEGPAGVHRGGPREPAGRPLAAPLGDEAPAGRGVGRAREGRRPHGRDHRDPARGDGGRGSGGSRGCRGAPSAADVPTTAQKVKEEEPAKEAGKGGGKDKDKEEKKK